MDTKVINLELYRYTKIWVESFKNCDGPHDFWETYASFLEFYKGQPDKLTNDLKEVLPKKAKRKKKTILRSPKDGPRGWSY